MNTPEKKSRPKKISPNKPDTNKNLYEVNERMKGMCDNMNYLIDICKGLILKVEELEIRLNKLTKNKDQR